MTDPTLIFYLGGGFGPQFAGEMIALKAGYFESNGVGVHLVATDEQSDFINQVAHTPSIGVTTGQKFLLAAWQGAAIVAFGASFSDTPTAIFSPSGSKIRAPKDLVGKRVGFESGSEDALVYQAMAERLGLSSMKINNISVSDGFSALRDGKVDAVVESILDVASRAADDKAFNVIKPSDYGIHIPGLVYFASASLVRDRPSVIRNTLRAVILGWADVYDDMDRSASTIVSFDPVRLTPVAVKSSLLMQRDLVRPVGARVAEFDPSRWDSLRDILVRAKAGEDTVGLSSLVSYEFLRDVYRAPLNPQIKPKDSIKD